MTTRDTNFREIANRNTRFELTTSCFLGALFNWINAAVNLLTQRQSLNSLFLIVNKQFRYVNWQNSSRKREVACSNPAYSRVLPDLRFLRDCCLSSSSIINVFGFSGTSRNDKLSFLELITTYYKNRDMT